MTMSNKAKKKRAGTAAPKLVAANTRAMPAVRLLSKAEVCAIANVTFPTLWKWMRDGTFPHARVTGGKSAWLSSEVDTWLNGLEKRALKGDDTPEAA
jgi:predicted DNA-binding transcriptional regulator AlpA